MHANGQPCSMSTDFDVQAIFLLECRHTDKVTDETNHPTHAPTTASVSNKYAKCQNPNLHTFMKRSHVKQLSNSNELPAPYASAYKNSNLTIEVYIMIPKNCGHFKSLTKLIQFHKILMLGIANCSLIKYTIALQNVTKQRQALGSVN